jgi:hypothetical protein
LQNFLGIWTLEIMQEVLQGQIQLEITPTSIPKGATKKELCPSIPQLAPVACICHVKLSEADACVFFQWNRNYVLLGVALPSFDTRKWETTYCFRIGLTFSN